MRTGTIKPSILIFASLGIIVFVLAVGVWYFIRVTASDAQGAYWADTSKIAVVPAGYVTNESGEVSAILAITNGGPHTFMYSAHIDTFNGRHWVNYPAGDIYVVQWATSLLMPRSSASMTVPVPSPETRWRAKLDARDVHGTGVIAELTCIWEQYVKKDYKNGCIYTQE